MNHIASLVRISFNEVMRLKGPGETYVAFWNRMTSNGT